MKRSAGILSLARDQENKENSCDSFDSTLSSNWKNETTSDEESSTNINNSPCVYLDVDQRLKPVSLSTHETNNVVSEDDPLNISNNAKKDELTTDTMPKQKPKIRNKNYCYFCKGFVLNFARHLNRHHIYEPEVQKILSTRKKSHKRKELITALRKKGNFIRNSVEVTNPMRKQKFTDYLPCTNCLGFYSRKLLWKHMKKCTQKSVKTTTNVQSEAQNLLVRHLNIDGKLKESVFLRMRADKTSLVAKSDVLICAFGSQYLKTHREKHSIRVVSRKMRELAKLLQEMRKINPSIKDLFDALKPINYDTIIAATKIVGKYDATKDRYESPTFAMNISTSIKQCCNIAILFAVKKQGPYMETNTAEVEADLKTLVQIIDSNWKSDISSQAASDLNTNKWNKATIVPLANDLKILKENLDKKSKEAANKIKEGEIKKGKKRTLIPWTAEQKKVCTTCFEYHIKNKQPPKRHECEALKKKHPNLFNNKDWLKIKVFIQNIYTKK